MQFLRNKIENTRKKDVLAFFLCFTWVFVVLWAQYGFNVASAQASDIVDKAALDVWDKILLTIAGLMLWLVALVGYLFILGMKIAIWVMGYNTFVNAQPVNIGWAVVRDICNMFFIVILLIIAFATILRIESFSYKRLLPSLVIFAVLINFSKTITGIFIDLGQVLMGTFVGAFGSTAESNFLVAVGYGDLLSLDAGKMQEAINKGQASGVGDLLMGAVLGVLFLVVATFVIFIIIIFLAWRIINLWVLLILSPIAFLCYVIPNGRKYAGKWWHELGTHVATGPVLAFFLWLALVVVGNPDGLNSELAGLSKTPGVGASTASSPAFTFRFIAGMGLLVAGMKVAQEFGGVAGNMAGWGSNKIGSMAKIAALGAVPWMFGRPWRAVGGDRLQRLWEGMKRGPAVTERGAAGLRAAWSGKAGEKHGVIGRIGKFWTGMGGVSMAERTERDEAALKEQIALRKARVKAKVYDEKDAVQQAMQGQANEKAEEMKKQNLTVPELKANIDAVLKKGTLDDKDQVQVQAGLMRLAELDKNMAREKFNEFEKKALGTEGYTDSNADTAAGRGFARLGVLLNKKAESNITGFKEDTVSTSGYLRLDEKTMRELREEEMSDLAGAERGKISTAVNRLNAGIDEDGNAVDRHVVGAVLGTKALRNDLKDPQKEKVRKNIAQILAHKDAFGVTEAEEKALRELYANEMQSREDTVKANIEADIEKAGLKTLVKNSATEAQRSKDGTLEDKVQDNTISRNILEGDSTFTRNAAEANSKIQGDNAKLEERAKGAKDAKELQDVFDEALGIKVDKEALEKELKGEGVILSKELENQLSNIKNQGGLDQFEKALLQHVEDTFGLDDAKNGLKAAINASKDLTDDDKTKFEGEIDSETNLDDLRNWYTHTAAHNPDLPAFNVDTAFKAKSNKVASLSSWDALDDQLLSNPLKQLQKQFTDKTDSSGSSFGIAGKTDTDVFQESRLNKDIEDEIALQEAVGKLASETDDEHFYTNKATILKYLKAMGQKGDVRTRILDNSLLESAKKKYINRSRGKRGFAAILATTLGATLGGGIPLAVAGGVITAGAMRAAASEKLTPVDRRNTVKQRENVTIGQLEKQLATLTKEALTKKALTDKEAVEVTKDIIKQIQQTCDTMKTYLYDKNDVKDDTMNDFIAATKDEFKKLDGKQVGDWQKQMSDLKSRLTRLKGYAATFTKK